MRSVDLMGRRMWFLEEWSGVGVSYGPRASVPPVPTPANQGSWVEEEEEEEHCAP